MVWIFPTENLKHPSPSLLRTQEEAEEQKWTKMVSPGPNTSLKQHTIDPHCWRSLRIAEGAFSVNAAVFFFCQPVHDNALDWGRDRKGDFLLFRIQNERSWTPHYLRSSPSKKLNFHFKRQTDLPPSPPLRFALLSPSLFSSALLPCPPSCSPSPDEGRLHKSVTQEIPTLYFLSDKEPVMGDELVAAGGFDRLWGNNKAISACQESRRKEREKHTRGRYKSLVW